MSTAIIMSCGGSHDCDLHLLAIPLVLPHLLLCLPVQALLCILRLHYLRPATLPINCYIHCAFRCAGIFYSGAITMYTPRPLLHLFCYYDTTTTTAVMSVLLSILHKSCFLPSNFHYSCCFNFLTSTVHLLS